MHCLLFYYLLIREQSTAAGNAVLNIDTFFFNGANYSVELVVRNLTSLTQHYVLGLNTYLWTKNVTVTELLTLDLYTVSGKNFWSVDQVGLYVSSSCLLISVPERLPEHPARCYICLPLW